MTDRELLVLAAKACGWTITGWTSQGGEEVAVLEGGSYWQPLLKNGITDCDGDAMRLVVTRNIDIGDAVYLYCDRNISNYSDPYDATRRAIVQAAAEFGKAMP